jgi:hypothetical protein
LSSRGFGGYAQGGAFGDVLAVGFEHGGFLYWLNGYAGWNGQGL